MTPWFGSSQGRVIRAVVLYLSNGCNPSPDVSIVVASINTTPWASLTFIGERHHLVVRLPADLASAAAAIEADDLIVEGFLVAVERADWAPAGAVLTLDLLAIATMACDVSATR